MRQSSVPQCSFALRRLLSSSSEIYIHLKMKFAVFFLLCLVAMAAAAPQLLAYPGYLAPGLAPIVPRTLVAGPTVVNGVGPLGLTRYITTGYVGPALY